MQRLCGIEVTLSLCFGKGFHISVSGRKREKNRRTNLFAIFCLVLYFAKKKKISKHRRVQIPLEVMIFFKL